MVKLSDSQNKLAVQLSLAVVASSHPIVKRANYGISDIGRKNALVLAIVGLILTTNVCTSSSSSGSLCAGLFAFTSVMAILATSPTLSTKTRDSSRRSVTGVFEALAEGEHATGSLLEFSTEDVVLKMTVGQPEVISKSAFTYPRLRILAYGDLTKLVDNTTTPRSAFAYPVSLP